MRNGFRIVVSIFRGTSAGRALSLMANGLVVQHDMRANADTAYEQFLDCAESVLCGVDKGIAFGIVSIVDCETCEIVKSTLLSSK